MNHPIPCIHDLLSYEEAADALGVAPSFVERLVAQRRITFIQLGRYVRFRRSDLDEFVVASRVPADGDVS